ncbi:MAG: MerR family DNA-binding transcriptional regulator [Caldilineaceae bacterium]
MVETEAYLHAGSGRAVQVSVQLVRNYEAEGFLPMAERSPNGWLPLHPSAPGSAEDHRLLMDGYGWQGTLHASCRPSTPAIWPTPWPTSTSATPNWTGRAVELAQTLSTLTVIDGATARGGGCACGAASACGRGCAEVGVPVSSLRFWEQQGLLHPVRERGSNYRLYDERQLRRLRHHRPLAAGELRLRRHPRHPGRTRSGSS